MLIGFVAIFIFPLFAVIVIAVSLVRAWRQRRARPLIPAANAQATDEDLVGTWRFEGETVSLRTDGTFTSSDGSQGRWSRSGECCLTTNGQEWAKVLKQGRLLLLKIHDKDPDNWNRYYAFSRERRPERD